MAYLIIDRSKISPEWDAATKLLYLWLCEEAAFSPHEWRGVMVEEGQYLTTLRDLAEVFNTTKDVIKRRLLRLQEFQSIKVLSIRAKDKSNRLQFLTLIAVERDKCNETHGETHGETQTRHTEYCKSNSYTPSKIESETHEKTHDETTITEYNITEIKDTESSSSPNAGAHAYTHTHEGGDEADAIIRELVETIRTDQASQYNIQSKSGISPYAAIEFVRDFANDVLMNGGRETGERGRKLVMHFTNWLQMELRRKARAAAEDKRNKQISSNGDPRQAAKDTAEAIRRDFFAKYGGAQPHSGISPTTGHLPDPRGIR